MLFRCLKFAVGDKSQNLAMAKSSFKLEHPLGMMFLTYLPILIDLGSMIIWRNRVVLIALYLSRSC